MERITLQNLQFEVIQFDPFGGHWLWQGSLNENGYGPYRVLYKIFREHPPRLPFTLDHLCRVRNCVNPWHLEVIEKAKNTRIGSEYRFDNARPWDFCSRGHKHSYAREIYMLEDNSLVCKCLNCLAEDNPEQFSWSNRIRRAK